jgi:hypothetical protein
MPKEIAIYLNLLYSRADTSRFFGQTSAKLQTDSAGNVMVMIKSIKLFEKLRSLLISHWVLN